MSSKLASQTLMKPIADLLGDSSENTTDYFQCDRNENNANILIPEHQRYYVWPESHQVSLIDSIMKNFPIPLLVFTEHLQNNKKFWYVQDGQQRLTTIQRFIQGKFEWNGKKFETLTNKESREFLGYQIACSIISNPTDTQVADIFERLNKGIILTNNDKLFNRKNEPIIKFTMNELKNTYEKEFKMYTNLNVVNKQRSGLSDVVGAVLSICSNNVDNITTSYERIGMVILKPDFDFTDEKKLQVINAFKLYFKCIYNSIKTYQINKPKKSYLQLSNMFGIWLYWYLKIKPNQSTEEENLSISKFMWFASKVQNNDKGKTIFKDISHRNQRNSNSEALCARTNHLLSMRMSSNKPKKELVKKEFVFEINDEPDEDEEQNEDEEDEEDDEDNNYEECRVIE